MEMIQENIKNNYCLKKNRGEVWEALLQNNQMGNIVGLVQ